MADAQKLSIVHRAPFQALQRRLDAAVRDNPTLATARDVLTRPLDLLQLMAQDAEGALGDDVLRADRLRTLLYLTVPFANVVEQAERLLQSGTAAPAVLAFDSLQLAELPEPSPYQPGVIDVGALPLLALAAVRVGPLQLAATFVRALHGLALSASAAEVLGRLDPQLPDEHALQVIVHTLHLLETLGSALRTPYLRTFALDPVERGRWRSLSEWFDLERLAAVLGDAPRWDGAHARGIQRVAPARAPSGKEVELQGDLDVLQSGGLPSGLHVVLADVRGQLQRAVVVAVATPELGPASIRIRVPDAAAPGWFGFSSDADIEASNAYRAQLRARLGDSYAEQVQAAATRIPVEAIPDLERADPTRPGKRLSVPPRHTHNRFGGGVPVLTYVDVEPRVVEPGRELLVSWESAGADEVLRQPDGVRLPATGSMRLTAPNTEGMFALGLQPVAWVQGERVLGAIAALDPTVYARARIAALSLRQDGRSAPLFGARPLALTVAIDPPTSAARVRLALAPSCAPDEQPLAPAADGAARGEHRFEVPAECVRDGLVLTVELLDPNGAIVERRTLGPLHFERPSTATVVLFRPAVLEPARAPAPAERAHAQLDAEAAARGLELELRELPWVDDALAVLAELPRSDEDPGVPLLLEVLAHRALVTPGLEHALWLAILPGAGNGVGAFAPTAATRAVAVADAAGLARVFDAAFGGAGRVEIAASAAPGATLLRAAIADPPEPRDVLRLHAVVRGGEVLSHQVVFERRRVGRSASLASPFTATTFDPEGRELTRLRLARVHPQLPHYVEALVPANAAVAAIALLAGEARLLHVDRPEGKLRLDAAELHPATQPLLSWRARHSAGVKPRVALAVRSGTVVTPVVALESCAGRDRVWLDRLGPADALVLQASDGWSLAELEVPAELPEHPRLALRRLDDGRYFADAPPGWELSWLLSGRRLAESARFLRVAPLTRGLLAVEARGPEGELRVDARTLSGDE